MNPPSSPTEPRRRAARGLLFALVLIALPLVLVELGARLLTGEGPSETPMFRSVALLPLRPDEARIRRALERIDRDPLFVADAELGWNVRPDCDDGENRTNAQGVRTADGRHYAAALPADKVRIQTVGDSLVYGYRVGNRETWQHYLGERRPDLELLNLGLPGAGTDQAYLRWRKDGRALRSHIVLLGIWPDDMLRNLSVLGYYRTWHSIGSNKPRLVAQGGAWKFVNLPVMSRDQVVASLLDPDAQPLLRHDYWYDREQTRATPLRRLRMVQIVDSLAERRAVRRTHAQLYEGTRPEAIDVTVAIAQRFAAEVRAAGAIPLVLMIPDRELLKMHTAEAPFPLVRALRAAGVDVVDLGPSFGRRILREGERRYYVDDGAHQSAYANRLFAEDLERALEPWIARARGAQGGAAPR